MNPEVVKAILESLRSHDRDKFKTGRNVFDKWERYLLSVAFGCFAAGILLALIYRHVPNAYKIHVLIGAYGLIFISQIACILSVLKQLYGSFKEMVDPVATFWDINGPKINHDAVILKELRRFGEVELDFAARRVRLEADQLRKRIQIVAPGVEKLGVLPAVGGAILSASKLIDKILGTAGIHLAANVLWAFFITIGLIYGAALSMLLASHRIDQLAQLISLAAKEPGKADIGRSASSMKAGNAATPLKQD